MAPHRPIPFAELPVMFDADIGEHIIRPGGAEVLGAALAMHIAQHRMLFLDLNGHALRIAADLVRLAAQSDTRGVAAALALLRDGDTTTYREALVALGQVSADGSLVLVNGPDGLLASPASASEPDLALEPPPQAVPVVIDQPVVDALFNPGFAEVLGAAQIGHLRDSRALVLGVHDQALWAAEHIVRMTSMGNLNGIAAALAVLRDGAAETMADVLLALGALTSNPELHLVNERDGILAAALPRV